MKTGIAFMMPFLIAAITNQSLVCNNYKYKSLIPWTLNMEWKGKD